MKCQKCQGEGQVADSSDQEPWSHWMKLPLESAAAVVLGIVKPMPCPSCGGTGDLSADAAILTQAKHVTRIWDWLSKCHDEFGDCREDVMVAACRDQEEALDEAIIELMKLADPERYAGFQERLVSARRLGERLLTMRAT